MVLSDSWWVQRLKPHLLQVQRLVNIQAPPEYGGAYLLDALRHQLPPLVWFEITERQSHDLVLQTNRLIEAFNKCMGQKIIDYGVNPPYILTVLHRYDSVFDRCTFVLSGSEHAPSLLEALREVVGLRHHLLAMGEASVTDAESLTRADLRLRPHEALQLGTDHFQLSEEATTTIFQKSEGVFEHFWVECHKARGLPIPYRPSAEGKRWPAGYETIIEPRVLISLYLKKKRYLEALEMAVEDVPQQVLDLLDPAASQAILQGEHEQFLRVLDKLPAELREHEEVLRWRLEASYLLGRQNGLRLLVLNHLAGHEAPDLRALAGNLWFFDIGEQFHQQALRAVQHKRSSLSVQALCKAYRWQMRHLQDLPHYVELSFEALQLAEEQNDPLQIIRAAGSLPYALLMNGQLQEAVQWANWALRFLERQPAVNALDRLMVISAWIYMRMLSEDTQDLERSLQDALALAEQTSDTVFYYLNTTWAEYCIIYGNPLQALDYWLQTWDTCARHQKGRVAYYLVRLLVALDRDAEAEKHAREAVALTADAPRWLSRYAVVSLALSRVGRDPRGALEVLKACDQESCTLSDRMWVVVPLLRQLACALLGETPPALDEATRVYLQRMGYNEHLEHLARRAWVDTLLKPAASPAGQVRLTIKALGEPHIALDGVQLDLPPKYQEILVLLAKHPDGLTGEQLLLELYGDEGGYGNLKALVSRLRRTVPIQSQPYRLAVHHRSDFQEFQECLRKGEVWRALHLYQGALLEQSTAPGIEALRHGLQQQLRAAAETTDDPEVLLQIAERLGEDLEAWEKALTCTARTNPKHAYVLSKVKQLREELGVH